MFNIRETANSDVGAAFEFCRVRFHDGVVAYFRRPRSQTLDYRGEVPWALNFACVEATGKEVEVK